MKQFLFLALIFAAFQARSQTQTLFDKTHLKGGFAAPIFEWGLNNNLGTSAGGGAGFVTDRFFAGAYGMGSIDFEQLIETGDVQSIRIAHGGIWLGTTAPTNRLVHGYGSAKIGWGAVEILTNDPFQHYRDLDKIFVLQPEAGLEINITRWCRVSGTVGYRYVSGINVSPGLDNSDFRGFTAGLNLRFGWFGNGI